MHSRAVELWKVPESMKEGELAVKFIDSDFLFAELCEKLADCPLLALDTEFMRTNTFYPKIGLLQLADETNCYLIDPLTITDWSVFKQLLVNPGCTFIIHSCGEDFNLLYTFLEQLPVRFFDTQIASSFLGLGFSLSYQSLVKDLLDIEIEKGETRSDWLRRPLTDKQIEYAAIDVKHLLELQRLLKDQLIAKEMLPWFEDECIQLSQIAAKGEMDKTWQNIYSTVSNAWKLDEQGLSRLQKLCYWREVEARASNKPRNWIAKDQDLLVLAIEFSTRDPADVDSLYDIRHLDRQLVRRYGKELLEEITETNSLSENIDRESLNTPISPSARKRLKSCQSAVRNKAEQLSMAPELLGRKKQLLEIVRNFEKQGRIQWPDNPNDWRKEVLLDDFERIFSVVDES